LVLTKGTWEKDEPVLVRVHSSCLTGDIFGSCRCDCGPQLHKAMELIEKEGKGAIVYMNQEGRGIGIENKIELYRLQQELGIETIAAYERLGFSKPDVRDYASAAVAIADVWSGKNIRLLTQNPNKVSVLAEYGYNVSRQVMEYQVHEDSMLYLHEMRNVFKHEIPHIDH
jgi:3,4-dihydroxy 2-butanone 4-phosphate synthase/GTP cyclohydrolase II